MGKISKEWWILLIIIFLTLGIGIFEWQKNPPATNLNVSTTANSSNRIEKEEANVTVMVEYLPDKSNNSDMAFQIALETHSVDLDAFDFQKDVRLEKDGKSILPLKINESGGGHHRKAEVTFKKATLPFVVAVENLAGVSRREFEFNNL